VGNVYLLYDASACVCVWQIMPQYCKRRADVTCSVEPIEGCLSEPLPSNSCHDDTWMKARLCWTLADDVCDNVSHYVVWTCCPADSIRTASTTADTSTDPRLTSEESSSCDRGVTVPPDLDTASHGNAGLRRTADANSVQDGPPMKIGRQDHCLVDSVVVTTSEAAVSAASLPDSTSAVVLDETSNDDVTVDLKTSGSGSVGQNRCLADELIWRCVGMTPVPSLGIEYKTLPGDGQPVMFRVQPMLFYGAVLPLINVVVKLPVR